MSIPVLVKPLPTDPTEFELLKLRLQVGIRRFLATNAGRRYLSQIYDNYKHIDRGLLDATLEKFRREKVIVYFEGIRNRKGQPITMVSLTECNPFGGQMIVQGEGIDPIAEDATPTQE